MKVSDLVGSWTTRDNKRLTSKQFSIRLPVHIAARDRKTYGVSSGKSVKTPSNALVLAHLSICKMFRVMCCATWLVNTPPCETRTMTVTARAGHCIRYG